MSIWGTLGASLLAVLARPSTWAFGLLGFLVRGGWLLVVAPFVVVPTPIGLANIVAPVLEDEPRQGPGQCWTQASERRIRWWAGGRCHVAKAHDAVVVGDPQ